MAMLRGSFRPGKVKDVAHFIPSLYFISSTAAVHAGEPAKPVEPARIAKPTSRFKAGADKPPPPLSADEYNLKKAVYSKEMRALRSKLYKELQVQRLHDIKAEREEAVSVEVGRQRKKEAAQAKKGQGRGARDQAAAELREVVVSVQLGCTHAWGWWNVVGDLC